MTGAPTIRALIVDDHRMVRSGLRGFLEGEPGLTVVGEAAPDSQHSALGTTNAETISILLVDDSKSVRRALRLMLGIESDFTIVCEATDGRHAVALAEQLRPDVVLMDRELPILGGIEAVRRIRLDTFTWACSSERYTRGGASHRPGEPPTGTSRPSAG